MEDNVPLHLIIRQLSGEASTEELEQLQRWVDEDPANNLIYMSYQEAWDQHLLHVQDFAVGAGLERLNARIDAEENQTIEPSKSFRWTKIAASIILAIAAAVGAYYAVRNVREATSSIVYIEYTSPSAQRHSVNLPDGSVVKLNSNSTLKYPKEFTGSLREVYLHGEAFFDVSRDSLRPFIVHTGVVDTRVLGTSFNIRGYDDDISVTVATGKVAVGSNGANHFLVPNEKITYNVQRNLFTKEETNLEQELAWKNNTLIFDDVPVEAAAKQLAQWYGVSIVFENESIGHCLITGKYKNESLSNVLEAIRFSTGITYTLRDQHVVFSGKGCE